MSVIVTMRNVRACKMCSSGARDFFKRHGLDWNKFLTEGLSEEQLLATGDGMARQVVEAARGRQE